MEFVSSLGTMHYDFHGESSQTIVLIHGFPLQSAMWKPQIQPLIKAGFSVLIPDLPGFGLSRYQRALSIDQMADEIYSLTQTMGIEPLCVGGMSMGGYVALSLAERYPQCASRLALIVTRAEGDSEEGRKGRYDLADKAREEGIAAVADVFIEKVMGDGSRKLRDDVYAMMCGASVEGAANALAAMAERADRVKSLSKITVPSLVVWAEKDKAMPAEAAATMLAKLPNASEARLPGGHMVNMEHPDEFNRALVEFLRA
ncbi:alpha/beta hydrolase [Desulfurispirillum indicum]|uniref:alpha/beta fold hydrolase n=1 Tax=Desulfurispirillum indicum TaxID=936456 RepID=UPI001CF9A068|nr:alpha/beta hydrolase [Desulfurispirillum indicum]UCZ57345.1 alpha/beta hydrolase [Desulfurispirillum indicum]